MNALTRNEMLREDIPADRELIAAGGLWVADYHADPADIVREARAVGARALHVNGKDLAFLAELPELEHLTLGDVGDLTPAMSLSRLRSFGALSWEAGRIDATAWPALTRFGVSEPPRGGGGMESAYAHPNVEVLAVRRYAASDLTPITAPRLRELHLTSGRLESLAGLEAHADSLELLSLFRTPRLTDLTSLASLRRLEVLAVDGARQVTTLDQVAAAPALRLLDIGDQRGIESLGPLAEHPTLEFLLFQKTGDMSLAALAELPRLRMMCGYQSRAWDRDLAGFPGLSDFTDDHPVKRDYFALRLRY